MYLRTYCCDPMDRMMATYSLVRIVAPAASQYIHTAKTPSGIPDTSDVLQCIAAHINTHLSRAIELRDKLSCGHCSSYMRGNCGYVSTACEAARRTCRLMDSAWVRTSWRVSSIRYLLRGRYGSGLSMLRLGMRREATSDANW